MRRIQRDISHEELVKNLTSGDAPIFRDIWRLLLFAAALGVRQKKRLPLEKVDSNKSMPENYFSTPAWRGFLYLIGFAESEGTDHLKNDPESQERLVIMFEEYANFGLHFLRSRILSPSSALADLTSLLLESGKSQTTQPSVEDLL